MIYSKEEEARIQEILEFAHKYYQEHLIATVDRTIGFSPTYKLEFTFDEVPDPPIVSKRTFYVNERVFDAVMSHYSHIPFSYVSTKYLNLSRYDTKETDKVQ